MVHDERHVGRIVRRLKEALERQANRDLRPYGITLAQAHVLMELHEGDAERLSFKQLEARLDIAQSTVWGIVSRLEKKGLVATGESPDDTRARMVSLTPEGVELCEACRGLTEAHERQLASDLTSEEASQLYDLLERACASVERTL